MSTQQPEALRLADALECAACPDDLGAVSDQAAAELRRLRAEVRNAYATIESLQHAVSKAQTEAARYANPRLIAQRDELLAALRRIDGFTLSQFMGPHDMALECVSVASDALDKIEAEGRAA